MENTIKIKSDGINVYAELRVRANLTGKIILTLMILLVIIFFAFVFSNINAEEMGPSFLGIVIIAVFFIGLPSKFLFWNLFGKEYLIVNTKSVSYQYDYGLFRTKLHTLPYTRLGTGFTMYPTNDERVKGHLLFYNYRADNDLPEVIHQTTVLVEKEHIKELDNEIFGLFAIAFYDQNGFIPYSAN